MQNDQLQAIALIRQHYPRSTKPLRQMLAEKSEPGEWTSGSVLELQQKRRGKTSPLHPRVARPMLVPCWTPPLALLSAAQASPSWHRTFALRVVLFHKGLKELALEQALVLAPLARKGFLAWVLEWGQESVVARMVWLLLWWECRCSTLPSHTCQPHTQCCPSSWSIHPRR